MCIYYCRFITLNGLLVVFSPSWPIKRMLPTQKKTLPGLHFGLISPSHTVGLVLGGGGDMVLIAQNGDHPCQSRASLSPQSVLWLMHGHCKQAPLPLVLHQ